MVNLLRATHDTRVPVEGCGCGFEDCWHVQTVRRSSNALTDYLWATPDLARGCEVDVMNINDSELLNVSDHAPVWADLVL
jgi:exonuclease III